MTQIGFVGLGKMGEKMVHRIVATLSTKWWPSTPIATPSSGR